MKRKAIAAWSGNGLEGMGSLTSQSGALNNTPYNFKMRFVSEDGKAGTNPEELLAASHAGCFNMQLSFMLAAAGFTADLLNTEASVDVNPKDGGFAITQIHLNLKAKIHGIGLEQFNEIANQAKLHCPISNALSATPISLETHLEA